MRLRVDVDIAYFRFQTYFNSTIVRLRETQARQTKKTANVFQFNHCAIKSERDNKIFKLKEDFNSTIVRLRDNSPAKLTTEYADFNSTIVRLRDLFGLPVNRFLCHFNSTIVRLRENILMGYLTL